MMRLLQALSLLIVFLPGAPMQTLASLVDKNRVLVVFAPSDRDAALQQQLKLLTHHPTEMKDRDLVVVPLLLQTGPPVAADTLRELQPSRISDTEQLTIRNQFHIAPSQFAVVFLGKDGGEKFRSATPVSMERLTGIIDAMPMRKDEVRRQAKPAVPPSTY